MKTKLWSKQPLTNVLYLFLLILLLLPYKITADDTPPSRTVRVGWSISPNFQYEDNDGNKTGYAYDYYQEIAKHADFNYIYVPGTWEECLQRLANGDIDVMSFVQYTPKRDEVLDYTKNYIGQTYAVLTTLTSNRTIKPNDYSTFNGKKVGVIKSFIQKNQFEQIMQKNQFYCFIIEFTEQKELEAALKNGDIDLILGSNFRMFDKSEKIVLQFSPSYLYLAVKKGNLSLKNKLDKAIDDIKIYDPTLTDRLKRKYFPSNNIIALTNAENALLAETKNVQFLVPVSRDESLTYSNKGGIGKGVYFTFIQELSKLLGINYEYIEVTNQKELANYLQQDGIHIILGAVDNSQLAKTEGYVLSSPYKTRQYYIISSKTTNDIPTKNRSFAIPKFTDQDNLSRFKHVNPQNITWYDTAQECLDALIEGKEDAALISNFDWDCYLNNYNYRTLKSFLLPNQDNLCFAVYGDTAFQRNTFANILSKGIIGIGSNRIEAIFHENARTYESSFSLEKLFFDHPHLYFGVLSTIIFAGFILIFLVYQNQRNKRRAELAQKTQQAKSEFLSRMSHELRTPMNAILGLSTLGQEEVKDAATVKQYFEKISSSGEFLLELVNDILDATRLENGKMEFHEEYINFPNLLNDILDMMLTLAQKDKIYIHTDFSQSSLVYGKADKTRLKQIYVNILTNAIKFSHPGDTVEWTVSDMPVDYNHRRIISTVRDYGIGMSEGFQAQLFSPFTQEYTQLSNVRNGTGLGLSIVKGLLDQLDGKINVISKEGKGSTFTVEFIIETCVANPNALIGNKPVPSAVTLTGLRVLLAEDNEINAIVTMKLLSKQGVTVVHAKDGQEAVKIFTEADNNFFDAILMDIRMPNLDGLEATEKIRSLPKTDAKTIPIIALTADALPEDREKVIAAGMNGHLAKPIIPQKLYEELYLFIQKKKQ